MSKYQALTNYLLAHCNEKTVQLNFDLIESLLYPDFLPGSAYVYREWWANDSYHSQANAWYKAGFMVSTVKDNTVFFCNFDSNRNPVVTKDSIPQIRTVTCPICKKRINNHSINFHINYEEEKYFGKYIKFQSSKLVCGICYGIINNYSPTYLQAHKEKKCLDKEYMRRF